MFRGICLFIQGQKERRKHPRKPFNRLVLVKDNTGITDQFIGINLSTHGMALNSETPLFFGDFVELKFWLTEPVSKEVNITAEVVKNYKQGNMYTTSVKFVGEVPLN